MTIINTLIAAMKKRLASLVAAAALLGATANGALAIDGSASAACPGAGCEIVAASTVDADPWGGLAITDANGRAWFLVSFNNSPLAEIGSAVEWSDGFAVIAAHDRYLDTLARSGAVAEKTSTDGRYHLCVSGGAVTCIYVPAG